MSINVKQMDQRRVKSFYLESFLKYWNTEWYLLVHLEFKRPDFSFWTLVFTRYTSTYCLNHDLMKIDDYSNLKRWPKKWMLCVCFLMTIQLKKED